MVTRNVEDVIRQIAAATDTPEETVSQMYAQTWIEYSEGARITDYLTVLVARRVRDDLRRRQVRDSLVSLGQAD
ncbi:MULTISPECIES: DUF3562 domain-containing protein [unclassified Paraburkholderia]|uniref:DUF3562 domain-containing protein n=1 Tax=unclassified Paraburkholderia TaxID=2615204 RepID=UPI0016094BFB|nr:MULTISPECIES: DUF3562 domain-containing protein [unclassified Paraburkholderia]MBB5413361.1 hypothetical protein [Paraburkholderia sp. HC6.4b]MBB5455639.1 hypothetical protein [Paraburkholderia sp. Kb1A]MBB5458082.1 hypothetical protein [Paraburkholderia sp. Cpub6]MBB5467610.1 hypothetical protein [Paraburkholderia sp. CI2]